MAASLALFAWRRLPIKKFKPRNADVRASPVEVIDAVREPVVVLYERYPGLALAESLGVQDGVELLDPPISSEGLYLTLSHNSACNDPWLRGQLAK